MAKNCHYSHSHHPHSVIAREGWGILFFFVILTAVTYPFSRALFYPLAVVTLFFTQFFRDPARCVAGDRNSVVSAAEGKVICIERTTDPYLHREATKVSVFMNVFNVHTNHAPVDGQILKKWYFSGKFFNASLDKSSVQNERCALWLRTQGGQDITCVQIAGLVARRILCYPEEGTLLNRGDRYGFIRFGSRVDLYLPIDAHILVQLGSYAQGSSTIIAQFLPTVGTNGVLRATSSPIP